MDARRAVINRPNGVARFGAALIGDFLGRIGELFTQYFDGDLRFHDSADGETWLAGEENDFGRVEGVGEFGGKQVGIHPKRFAIRTERERGDHGDHLIVDQAEEKFAVDAIDPASELLIDTFDDAGG